MKGSARMLFGKREQSQNMVSVDVPALVKNLVDSIIGALCEKFVTRADVESIVLETIEKMNVNKKEPEPVVEEPKPEPSVTKPVPRIVGNPSRHKK